MILVYLLSVITVCCCIYAIVEHSTGRVSNGLDNDNFKFDDIIKFKLDENITSLFNYRENLNNLRYGYRRHHYSIRSITTRSFPVMLVYERMMVNVVGESLVFHYIIDNMNTRVIAKLDVSIFEDMLMNEYVHMRCNDSIDIVGMLQLKPVVYKFDKGMLKTTSLGYAMTGKKELYCVVGLLDGKLYHKGKLLTDGLVVE